MSRRSDMHGFTLVELMIVLVLLGIVATIAVPNFNTLIRNNQLQSKADELVAFLQHARGQAVINRSIYEVKICNDDDRWIIRKFDASNGGNCEDGKIERLLEHKPEQAEILNTTLSDNRLVFRPNGTATAARFTLCRDSDPVNGYLLEVKVNGNVSLYPRGDKDAYKNPMTTCTPQELP
ncbi:Type II secretion system protein H OS=Stutzerimonas stutzeri OX=316 GN=CH92_03980 PE=3 SV=1 [Stutzerimonas stutzeri]